MTVTYNQSGYCGSSRSVRAFEAEQDNKYPKTTLCSLFGLKAPAVEVHGSPCEAHHTSKYANLTDFYDARDFLRSRILRKVTTARPTAAQLYNRLLTRREMIYEAAGYNRFSGLLDKIKAKLQHLDTIDAIDCKKRIARREKRAAEKRAIEEAAAAKRREEYLAVCKKNQAVAFATRCAAMKITKEKIKEALTTTALDSTGLIFQIQRWFVGYSVEEAIQYGI